MNYTPNHHLPQWVKSDRIMMDDFNQMCKDIESGLNTAVSKANSAQSAANTAQSAANSAQSTANTALSSKPYATGTYTGTGADITINVGFRPSFVIINGMTDGLDMSQLSHFGYCSAATSGLGPLNTHVQFTSTGISVLYNKGRLPKLSDSGRFYEYIAFK